MRFAALKKVGLTAVHEVCNCLAQKSKLKISLGGLERQLQQQTKKKRSLATLDAIVISDVLWRPVVPNGV